MIRKFTLTAAAALPAIAMFAGVANAGVVDRISNGTFNINTKGWTVEADASLKKHDGFPMAVLTNEKNGGKASSVSAHQCVAIDPGQPVHFSGRAFIPNNQDRTGSATFAVSLFKDDNCSEFAVGAQLPALTTTAEWKTFTYNPVPWPGSEARSARVAMVVEKDKSGVLGAKKPFMAYFDDIKLTQIELEAADDGECLCEPAAETPEPAVPDAGESDGSDAQEVPDEAPGGDQPSTDEPVADEPITEPQVDVPADEPASETPDTEPAAPIEPAAPGVPSNGSSSGSNGAGSQTPGAPATGSTSPGTDGGADEVAEASEQQELLPSDDAQPQSEITNGQDLETPGAPETGIELRDTNGFIGADQLGLVGAALAVFGLGLAVVGIRKNRAE